MEDSRQLLQTQMYWVSSTSQQISSSPVNTSKSKMLYSFSKAPRFPNSYQPPCDNFYQINSPRSKRAAGFGYDHKYDFTKDLPSTPPPNTYNLLTLFDSSKIKKKGFGFGQGRSEMQITGPLAAIKVNKNPGPGSYQLTSKPSTAYSIKGKIKPPIREQQKVPGPGTYQIEPYFNPKGKHCLSHFKNNPKIQFSRSSQRFKTGDNKAPGPGNYDTSNIDLNPVGNYFYSKTPNSKSRKFNKAHRSTLSAKSLTPGPGNYQLPSEFGYYKGIKKSGKQRLSQNKQNIE